jgi:hypothetical protein
MTEEALHRACAYLLGIYRARGVLEFTHPANGAHKSRATAGAMKAMGQTAGVPDLLVWAAGGKHFQCELKTAKGRLSPAQEAWMDRMAAFGFRVYLCRSVEGLQEILALEGLPRLVKVA